MVPRPHTVVQRKLGAQERHVEAFAALGQLSRLQVFFFLVRKGEEVSAGELARALSIPGPTLSHHLETLRRSGLVQRRREGRFLYYRVEPTMVSDLTRLLTACC